MKEDGLSAGHSCDQNWCVWKGAVGSQGCGAKTTSCREELCNAFGTITLAHFNKYYRKLSYLRKSGRPTINSEDMNGN